MWHSKKYRDGRQLQFSGRAEPGHRVLSLKNYGFHKENWAESEAKKCPVSETLPHGSSQVYKPL